MGIYFLSLLLALLPQAFLSLLFRPASESHREAVSSVPESLDLEARSRRAP